jgi:hypothetical protein
MGCRRHGYTNGDGIEEFEAYDVELMPLTQTSAAFCSDQLLSKRSYFCLAFQGLN